MRTNWYCTDCGTTIDTEEVETHEAEGHHVRGKLMPDRLLSNDPWEVGDEPQADEGGET